MAKVRLPNPAMQRTTMKRDKDGEAKIPAEDYKALPIIKNKKHELALVKHCIDRVMLADVERKRRIVRLTDIDVQLSGYIARTNKDDKKRDFDNKKGRTPKPVDQALPLALAQIFESVTYLMSVYAPQSTIFEALASADKQQLAQALTARVNRDGQRGQYYRQLYKFCLNAVKYNLGILTCNYEKYQGIVYQKQGQQAKKTTGTMWEGNAICSADAYNFFYDTSVHPVDLPMKGEFFAEVERITPFRVRALYRQKKVFGIERFINEIFVTGGSMSGTFYQQPPSVRDPASATGKGNQDWRSVFAGGEVKDSTPGIEFIHYTTWIVPSEHGLSDSDDMELWRIVIANSKFVAFAVKLEDAHGMLPVVSATPLEDDLVNEQRTFSEMLLPLQHFGSFLVNSHQAAQRKAIGGITIYNPHLIAGMDLSRDDLIGARIPIKSTSTDFDIDKAFRHYTDTADTAQNMNMLTAIDGIMQKILPTDTLRQVASLERATLYQAAATVQAGDRRNYTIACLTSDQALTPLKLMMIYNIYANVTALSYINPITGEQQEVQVADMVEAEIENYIGTGLKGLDRLMTLQIYRDIVTYVIQSQQAIEEIDIVQLLNYYATLAGDRTDLNQFKRQPQEIQQLRDIRAGVPSQAPLGLPGKGRTQAAA